MTDLPSVEIDARGLLCPLPVLRARKALLALPGGALIALIADDPMAEIDLPHFCGEAGHDLVSAEDHDGARLYVIRRGAQPRQSG